MKFIKSTEAKLTSILGGMTVISVGLLSAVNPAQAAQLGAGRFDVTSLPNGFVIYTENALDFTSERTPQNFPVPSPDPNPGVFSNNGTEGFAVISGVGSLVTADNPLVIDQLALDAMGNPIPIPEVPDPPLIAPVPADLFVFDLDDTGQAVFKFDSVVRDVSGGETVDLLFTGFISDLEGNQFDDTPAEFAVLTGQVSFPIANTDLLTQEEFNNIEVVCEGDPAQGTCNFTGWSATVEIAAEPEDIPESSTVLGALLVLGSFSLLKRKVKNNPAS
ncbi:MAG: hypothetical protein QNJ65_20195 [Xenococcaceae cyanobacterium MO_234.B1]|nr:hypothetical protein [Xenococcaceae cyanobacterium MO_234.B1]